MQPEELQNAQGHGLFNHQSAIINQQFLNAARDLSLLLYWFLFNLFALGLLVFDLRVVHRASRVLRAREALGWSVLYVALAGLFAVILLFWQGHQAALEFVTGYVVEVCLSVDNLFIFLLIFKYFAVPEDQQHRVLFWGIIGALAMRGVFIGAGVGLIHRFHWVLFLVGGLLFYSGIRIFFSGEHQVNPTANPLVKALRRFIPVTDDYKGGRFFVRNPQDRLSLYATPLLIVLVVIETTDLLFAIDSIPAILAITLNAFIVYTSNVLAILGLRSMYFAVSRLIQLFRFLHYGLALVLVLVGLKIVMSRYFPVPISITLTVVAGILMVSVVASVLSPARGEGR
jgi:tellurite resistance protein TerC